VARHGVKRAGGCRIGAERVSRRLEDESVADVDELARLVLRDLGARERFRRSVAMVVTGLFRDPDQFELLERERLSDHEALGLEPVGPHAYRRVA
jgi:chemotaxis methyl-accepting protein methylase